MLLADEGAVGVEVNTRQLYLCPAELSEIRYPPVYKQFILADVSPANETWSSDVIQWLRTRLMHKTMKARMIEKNRTRYILLKDSRGISVAAELLSTGRAVPPKQSLGLQQAGLGSDMYSEASATTQPLKYSSVSLPMESSELCFVTNIEKGPWRFYLQFESQRTKMPVVQNKLQQLAENDKLVQFCPKEGDAVVCLYRNQLCRGLVTEMLRDGAVVVYGVDNGMTFPAPFRTIYTPPPWLLDIPPLACRCCLDGLVGSEDDRISDEFSVLVKDRLLYGLVVHSAPVSSVCLVLNGQSVLTMITPLHYEPETIPEKFEAVISHISEAEAVFYLQLERNQEKLLEMQEKLQEEDLPEPVQEKLKPGLTCLAVFPADGLWYRAVIVREGEPLTVGINELTYIFDVDCQYCL